MTILERRGANFFGFEVVEPTGKTRWQLGIRGNGNLTLTDTTLTFNRWLPPAEFVIPVRGIRSVEIGRGHNGKWILFKIVLRVRFEDTDGKEKIAGFTVGWAGATQEWKQAIERAAGIVGGG